MKENYNVSALAIEAIIDKIPSRRLAWAEFNDGSVGLTTITEEEEKELRMQMWHDPLPKHYRDQGV